MNPRFALRFVLLVALVSAPGDCIPGVDVFVYEAVLGNLSPGLYQLRVLHVLTGHAAYVALEEEVQVS